MSSEATSIGKVLSDAESTAPDRSVSSSLLSAARGDDPLAWRSLVEQFAPQVYTWARGKGLQPADAEDLCQDVFLAVARRLSSFRRDRAEQSFRLWLWIITQNKICDRFRRAGARDIVGGSQAERILEANALAWEQQENSWCGPSLREAEYELLAAALLQLQATVQTATWEAFWLVTVEEQSPDLVAERLGISRNSVYVARSRVLSRLRTLMAPPSAKRGES
jgi:RNA polymerase sigma-70 factor (ECF subfamily)